MKIMTTGDIVTCLLTYCSSDALLNRADSIHLYQLHWQELASCVLLLGNFFYFNYVHGCTVNYLVCADYIAKLECKHPANFDDLE
jgi:hypothetical protein